MIEIKNIGFFLAFPQQYTNDYNVYIDCAVSMLQNNIESESICILTGLTKPFNFFEIKNIIRDAKDEIKMTQLTYDESIIAYAFELVKELVTKKNILLNLELLSNLAISNDYHESIYDFYQLYFAWEDLEYQNVQFYWNGMNLRNRDKIVDKVANDWLTKYTELINNWFKESNF